MAMHADVEVEMGQEVGAEDGLPYVGYNEDPSEARATGPGRE